MTINERSTTCGLNYTWLESNAGNNFIVEYLIQEVEKLKYSKA